MRDLETFLVKTRVELDQGKFALTTAWMLCDELEHRQKQERLLVQAYDLTLELLEDLFRAVEADAPVEAAPMVAFSRAKIEHLREQAVKIKEFVG